MLRSVIRLAPLTNPRTPPQATRIISGFSGWQTTGPAPPTVDPNEWWKKLSKSVPQGIPQDQFSGRSIKTHHSPRSRMGGIFRRLGGLLARTGVRKDIRLAEFHEKRSDKRRRLESERHRRRFQEMVSVLLGGLIKGSVKSADGANDQESEINSAATHHPALSSQQHALL